MRCLLILVGLVKNQLNSADQGVIAASFTYTNVDGYDEQLCWSRTLLDPKDQYLVALVAPQWY